MCIENEKVSRSQSFELSCAIIYGTHLKVKNAQYRHVNKKCRAQIEMLDLQVVIFMSSVRAHEMLCCELQPYQS